MKNIKRILLSALLLQTVCQPVHAEICFDSESAAPSTAQYIPSQSEYSEQTKIVSGIVIALLMIHLTLAMYDWYEDNQIGQKQPRNNIDEKANFVQFEDDYNYYTEI